MVAKLARSWIYIQPPATAAISAVASASHSAMERPHSAQGLRPFPTGRANCRAASVADDAGEATSRSAPTETVRERRMRPSLRGPWVIVRLPSPASITAKRMNERARAALGASDQSDHGRPRILVRDPLAGPIAGHPPSGWHERQRGATLARTFIEPNRRDVAAITIALYFASSEAGDVAVPTRLAGLRSKKGHAGDRERRCLPSRPPPALFHRASFHYPESPLGATTGAATGSRDERQSTPPRLREGTVFSGPRRGGRPAAEALRATTSAAFRP